MAVDGPINWGSSLDFVAVGALIDPFRHNIKFCQYRMLPPVIQSVNQLLSPRAIIVGGAKWQLVWLTCGNWTRALKYDFPP